MFSVFGISWGALGHFWGALGALLGRPGVLLGRFWTRLGRSWGVLGRSWAALGALLDASWGICLGYPPLSVRHVDGDDEEVWRNVSIMVPSANHVVFFSVLVLLGVWTVRVPP